MHEQKTIEEASLICNDNLRFQFDLKSCITEFGIKVCSNLQKMEVRTEDMKQNPKGIVAFSEIAGQRQDKGLIDKFQEELKNCKTKQEQERFFERMILAGK